MINTIVAVVGVGMVCFLMLYFLTILDSKKHFILQLLIMVFVMTAMLLIPKAVVDSQNVCETVVSNSTTGDNVTFIYEYEEFCFVRPETTGQSFLQLTQRFYYLVLAYAIVSLAVVALFKLRDAAKRGRK